MTAIFIKQTRFLLYNMVSGKHKSRSMRRVFRRVPKKGSKLKFKKRKPSKAKCAGCGKTLSGVPRERPYKMKNMPKTAKRPQRPYGGVLCSACSRKEIVKRARAK
jgi:large subunit ribosomal protein L34e